MVRGGDAGARDGRALGPARVVMPDGLDGARWSESTRDDGVRIVKVTREPDQRHRRLTWIFVAILALAYAVAWWINPHWVTILPTR